MTRKKIFRGTDAEKDLTEFLAALPRAGIDETYSEIDRARDFLAVFNTSAGQRVLAQIHAFCNPDPLMPGNLSTETLCYREGQRRVFLDISRAMVARKAVPTQQRKEPENVD